MKFELSSETVVRYGRTLFRIRALIDFETKYGSVKKGDLGGFVEKEASLSQEGNAWIYKEGFAFKEAVIRGGEIRGGEIWGGVIWGGEIRGGEIRGGVIRGGVIRGGEIWGGVIWGGEIWGGVIKTSEDIFVALNVGSSSAVLTAYRLKDGTIEITRGCFRGSLSDFEKAVKERHGKGKQGAAYKMLISYIKYHFTKLHKA